MTKNLPLSYIQISQNNLISNIENFRSFINSETKIMAVIKANAYGHDIKLIASMINDYVDYFQVDDIEEFESIKDIVSKPIMILGYVQKSDLEKAIVANAILAIYDTERLVILNQIAQRLGIIANVHVKIDAMLGRQGLLLSDIDEFILQAKKCSHVNVRGIYSHFANIEDTTDFSHAQMQIDEFDNAKSIFQSAGYDNLLTHISATSGIMEYEKNTVKNQIVRLGIGMYGLWPSVELKNKLDSQIKLLPVLKFVSHVAQIKTLPANFTVGYGLTYTTEKPTKVAVIPVGYSDGYDRELSNKGRVLINGTSCPIIGRIAMNMFVVDVSGLPGVNLEDEVVLVGRQGDKEISAEEIADSIGTINYEVIARISPLLNRIKE